MDKTVAERNLRLVSPEGVHLSTGQFKLNDRPEGLAGKRLGLLENTKSNSDKVLREFGEILKERHGLKEVVHLSKHNASLPTKPEVIQQMLEQVDVLVTGVGD